MYSKERMKVSCKQYYFLQMQELPPEDEDPSWSGQETLGLTLAMKPWQYNNGILWCEPLASLVSA